MTFSWKGAIVAQKLKRDNENCATTPIFLNTTKSELGSIELRQRSNNIVPTFKQADLKEKIAHFTTFYFHWNQSRNRDTPHVTHHGIGQ